MSQPEDEASEWLRSLRKKAGSSEKSWSTALWCSILLGYLGVDRFYLGYGLLGLIKLCSFGGFFVWWIIDVVLLVLNRLPDAEGGILARES